MKGEYLESPTDDRPEAATPPPTLFAKLHHPFSLHHFRPSPPSPDKPSPTPKAKTPADPPSGDGGRGDGSSIEVVRRPRGRPPGSKNKPKPPVVITRDPEPSLSPYILEVPCGSDVVACLHGFCRRRSLSLSVLSASGSVSNFTLRQPPSSPASGATLTFRGRFDILSISATLFSRSPPASSRAAAAAAPNVFSISLAGPQGQIVGGSVAGPLVAAGPVFVVAASFNSPTFHRLTDGDEAENARRAASEGGSGGGEEQSPQMSSGGDSGPGHQPQVEPVYSCHLPSDVIWAPRQPPQPPYN